MIWRLFRPNPEDRSIGELYGAIVAQARSPAFYRDYGVPDTVQGRFDLIVLHLVLLIDRLGREAGAGRGIGQRLFDVFCSDLDDNLREMGVGDLAVPKRMRRFGEAFYGRQAAYLAAFAAADERELEKALRRNIFQDADAKRSAVRLARYVRAARREFAGQEDGALLRGEVVFPQPQSIAEAIDHA
jgi:cytochrome b pre-mRNA-processing protein 3